MALPWKLMMIECVQAWQCWLLTRDEQDFARAVRITSAIRVEPADVNAARAAAPGPLCRCPVGVCYLHPSLTTCGMRERAAAPESESR
jgi:hypothetical protein